METQMLQQELNELGSNLFLNASSSSNPSPPQFLNSEPLPTTTINSPATPPYSPLAAATTGININASPRREISSPQYGRYHDHDNLARPHQYQRFSPSTPIDELRGNVVTAAMNQHGSRFLQDKLRHENPENIDMIFSGMKESLWSLMVRPIGYHVVQKLIDVVDDKKLDEILDLLTRDILRLEELCAHDHGTNVVQKLVGRLTTQEQQFFFASVMSQIALSLTKSINGSAVISQCLINFSPSHKKLLLRAIAVYCHDIAQCKSGCCILQKCFNAADDEMFNMLAAAIIQNADTLSENCNGSYNLAFFLGQEGQLLNQFIQHVDDNVRQLQSHMYGRRVLQAVNARRNA
ncbi:Pumilio-12-like protein [Morus notabilis]|uniref:Pumilio-12-like protein n=1 Tax=Morus notabilis TaxID=981085 RepID=W9RXS8_9ROSA|nr:Pumilio-12-like protein [Morus notabilis]